MNEKNCETSNVHDIFFHIVLKRLLFTAFQNQVLFIVLKRLLFTTFQNQVVLEKLHSVKFTGTYENKNARISFWEFV